MIPMCYMGTRYNLLIYYMKHAHKMAFKCVAFIHSVKPVHSLQIKQIKVFVNATRKCTFNIRGPFGICMFFSLNLVHAFLLLLNENSVFFLDFNNNRKINCAYACHHTLANNHKKAILPNKNKQIRR